MPTSASTSPGVRTLTTAGLGAVVGALVLGILGMHSLGQHSPTTHDTHRVVASATVDPHASHPDHAPVTVGAARTTVGDGGLGPSSDDHEPAVDMVMFCAAMLLAAAAGVLLTLRLVRPGHRAPLSLRLLFRALAIAATARAGTGPPAVWGFSVVRC